MVASVSCSTVNAYRRSNIAKPEIDEEPSFVESWEYAIQNVGASACSVSGSSMHHKKVSNTELEK